MTTVKIKFRPSTVKGKEGIIYYQIIHNRIVRQLKTNYRIFETEWDCKAAFVKINANEARRDFLLSVGARIKRNMRQFRLIIRQMENKHVPYTADDIISVFNSQANIQTTFNFMLDLIAQLKQMGKYRTSETYRATLKSFMAFRNSQDLLLDEIDSDLMIRYEAYLQEKGLVKNTISFYMRILRAAYNRAVEKNLTWQRNPFRHVFTASEKTVKRAVALKYIRKLKRLDFSDSESKRFARDMFLFSFYTRGMAFVDIAYLRKKDVENGILSYRRHKTGQLLFIKWERCMQEIVDKYDIVGSDYLLPIIDSSKSNERYQYIYAAQRINYTLKLIGRDLKIPIPLTLYVARHSWASIARGEGIPVSVISEGMGHDSERTTQIYLASLETQIIDKANRKILRLL